MHGIGILAGCFDAGFITPLHLCCRPSLYQNNSVSLSNIPRLLPSYLLESLFLRVCEEVYYFFFFGSKADTVKCSLVLRGEVYWANECSYFM